MFGGNAAGRGISSGIVSTLSQSKLDKLPEEIPRSSRGMTTAWWKAPAL